MRTGYDWRVSWRFLGTERGHADAWSLARSENRPPYGWGMSRARDTRLGRDVAIKVLPEALAHDADRLRRFEQEARTIAALNHPNILGIHDIGTHDGAPFLVSEFLEGQTLRDKLVSGPLPVRRAIEYALGIAQGLAAAHEKGIVHRDVEPENVFVTRDGRIKVLDFGLAKLVRPEGVHEAAVTLASAATLPGMVMGTVGYMSPEQVRGESCDARSDIFSFGAVLYEMLTGKDAFKHETSAETMTAILREEPLALSDTGWQGPLELQRILARCLEKNVARRFQSASDLAFAIESLSGTSPRRIDRNFDREESVAAELKASMAPVGDRRCTADGNCGLGNGSAGGCAAQPARKGAFHPPNRPRERGRGDLAGWQVRGFCLRS